MVFIITGELKALSDLTVKFNAKTTP